MMIMTFIHNSEYSMASRKKKAGTEDLIRYVLSCQSLRISLKSLVAMLNRFLAKTGQTSNLTVTSALPNGV